jgi:tight adherence protein B
MYVLILIAIVLVGGITALIGAYLVTRRFRRKVQTRVAQVALAGNLDALDLGRKGLANKFLNRAAEVLKRFFALGIANSWGMKSGSGKLILTALISGAAAWLFMYYLLDMHHLIMASVSIVAAFLVPNRLLRKEQRKAERKFNDLFPDAVEAVARMLRAGLPATAALRAVGEDAQEPVGDVFRTISDQMRIGIPFSDALNAASQKIGLPDFQFFTVAVSLQYATGGNLVVTLETLSSVIRKQRAVRSKAKAVTSEIRLSAYVLGSLPFLTLGALLLIQPEYLAPLINDPRGHIVLGMAAGGLLLSMITMKKMMASVING